ncbi:MAG: hypothetical protein NTW19_22095 [Planctomycetota bacterium]|nr:hypothetical protein [Planctomycetota bacterium]
MTRSAASPLAANAPAPTAMVELRGSVAGIKACEILTDRREILVGSALDCDLVVHDPLVPRKAFQIRLGRERENDDVPPNVWLLEALPGARIFVNNNHARRERLAFGDVISVGCHRFHFENGAVAARPQRTDTRVDDVCARLLDRQPIPAGFLNGLPTWRDRIRGRKAALCGLLLALFLLTSLLFRGEQKFVSSAVQGPVEVSLAPKPTLSGAGSKSLKSVERKAFNSAEAPAPVPADLQPLETPAIEAMAADTLKPTDAPPAAPPPPPVLAPANVDAGPQLGALVVGLASTERADVRPAAQTLAGGAAVRRAVVAQAEQTAAPADLGQGTAGGVRTDNVAAAANATSMRYANELSQQKVAKPVPGALTGAPSQALADIAAYRPSPVKYEQYNGNRVPVARLPESLGALAVADPVAVAPGAGGAGAAAGAGTGGKAGPGKGIVLDGQITEDEISVSWKSGRFRLHGPGTPPEANPATFCYVGTAEEGGRKYLYISFLCVDPNVDQILAHWHQNDTSGAQNSAHEIILDDSVEIFLDTKFRRADYNQIIVNAHGAYWTAYYDKPESVHAWPVDLKVKTTINKQAGNWVCEILVPFDKLGGVPPKGSKWAVNFCRNFRGQKADDQLQTWFLVYDKTRNFHHPALFGVFEW